MDLKKLAQNRIVSYVIASVCIALGVCFCVVSEAMLSFFETAICFALIIYGAFNLVVYCLVDSDSKQRSAVLKGIIAIFVGLLIIFVRAFFMIAIGIIIGGLAVLRIIRAVKMKELKMKNWIYLLVVSVVLLAANITLIVLSICAISKITLMIIVGAILCVQGAYDLTMLIVEDKKKENVTVKPETKTEEKEQVLVEGEVKAEEFEVVAEVAEEVEKPQAEEPSEEEK